ncbi:MAG: B12-binding domain-containing protein [Paracoccaceae bacterium]|nr:MAG: B12-binding domain-containing protein [Paracoccaceae bacterium]
MNKDDRLLLDAQAFERAKGLFVAPSPRLPGKAVEALASEVLARLSSRGGAIDIWAAADSASRMEGRIESLSHALLALDDAEATEIVMQAHTDGVPVETLYLGLLAEAARRLGRWWEEDRITSVEVVIGAGRIYAIMRGLRRLFGRGPWRGERFRAVFASVPGETHILGVAMAADLLTMHGWEIDLRAGLDHDRLVAEIGNADYPIIGLSASSGRMLFPLARLIVALRVSNPGAWIMACGGITDLEPDVAALVDADAAARDVPAAERMMESYVAQMQGSAQL